MQNTVRIGTIILSLGMLCLALVTRVGGEEPTQPTPKKKTAPKTAPQPAEDGKLPKEPGPKRFKVNLKHAQKQLDLEWAELIQTKKDLEETERRIREKLKEFRNAKDSVDSHRKKSIKTQKDEIDRTEKKGKARIEDLKMQQADLEDKLRVLSGTGPHSTLTRFQRKIQRLTAICEKMPPEAAARFIEGLKLKLATAIMANMKVRRAAAIMTNLNVETAAKISERYLKNDVPAPYTPRKKRRD
jgi:flagellar motility protein MotE (MotC chaperone)